MIQKKLNAVKSLLNGMFQYAFAELEIIDADICTPLVVNSRKGYNCIPDESHNTEVYTHEEREQILAYLEKLPRQTGYTWAARLMFCFDCRVGEIKGLLWSDYYPDKFGTPMMSFHSQVVIDLDASSHHFLNHLGYTKGKKVEGSRLEPVTPRAMAILDEIKATNPTSEYILTTQAGNPLYQTGRVNDVIKKACNALGIDYHPSHKCRFYSITEQTHASLDLNTVARNSGHLYKNTTIGYMRYVAMNDSDLEKWLKVHN